MRQLTWSLRAYSLFIAKQNISLLQFSNTQSYCSGEVSAGDTIISELAPLEEGKQIGQLNIEGRCRVCRQRMGGWDRLHVGRRRRDAPQWKHSQRTGGHMSTH